MNTIAISTPVVCDSCINLMSALIKKNKNKNIKGQFSYEGETQILLLSLLISHKLPLYIVLISHNKAQLDSIAGQTLHHNPSDKIP